jgi:hypothetical protein
MLHNKNPQLQLSLLQVQECPANYYLECLAFAQGFIRYRNTFTSEDIIAAFDISPIQPAEPRVWGAVIRELKRMNLIEHNGFTTYKKPEGHSKPVNVWKSLIFKG